MVQIRKSYKLSDSYSFGHTKQKMMLCSEPFCHTCDPKQNNKLVAYLVRQDTEKMQKRTTEMMQS